MFIYIRYIFYSNNNVISWKNTCFLCNSASQLLAWLLQISWYCFCWGLQISVILRWFQVLYILAHSMGLFKQISTNSQVRGAFKYYVNMLSTLLDPPTTLCQCCQHRLRPPTPFIYWHDPWIEGYFFMTIYAMFHILRPIFRHFIQYLGRLQLLFVWFYFDLWSKPWSLTLLTSQCQHFISYP